MNPSRIAPQRGRVGMFARHLRAASWALALLSLTGTASADGLTLVEPYGPASSTHVTVTLLKDGLAATTGAPVAIEHVPGRAGGAAFDHVAAGPADGTVLLVVQLLTPLADAPAAGTTAASLTAMHPIAKLTSGFSAALIVAHASPIRSYDDLKAAAAAGPLTAAYNPIRLFTLPLAMLEAGLGTRFALHEAHTREAMLKAIDGGTADFAFLPTISLLSGETMPALPILTFGGARHPRLETPTFREVEPGQNRTAITGAIAVFAPAGTPSAIVARLTDAFVAAGERADVKDAAGTAQWPLLVEGPDMIRLAMERNQRVVRDLKPHLR